ncbi:hypothetical protein Ancab_037528 [Ancistrocladus abbreviatus]
MSCSHPPTTSSASSSSSKEKIAETYSGDSGNGTNSSRSSTLEKLYFWEKKLYKEVKRIRVVYEKKCKKLKTLDEQGAKTSKIEATQASIRTLLTRLNVSISAVDAICSRIHKLRDEELLPQLKELIYGYEISFSPAAAAAAAVSLTFSHLFPMAFLGRVDGGLVGQGLRRMWKSMLNCHRKQFQAILESKIRTPKANTGLRRDSKVRTTLELEVELLKWCILHEPEETPDGTVPFSPGRIGAPPPGNGKTFSSRGENSMHDFATSLHQLWERQDEEQLRRVRAECALKDFEKQIQNLHMEKPSTQHDHGSLSDKARFSMVWSDGSISQLDDLKVDLDSVRQRVREERAGHKEAVKLVHEAVSRSIGAGLVPIFEALESFTSEALKAYENVRLQHGSGDS